MNSLQLIVFLNALFALATEMGSNKAQVICYCALIFQVYVFYLSTSFSSHPCSFCGWKNFGISGARSSCDLFHIDVGPEASITAVECKLVVAPSTEQRSHPGFRPTVLPMYISLPLSLARLA